MGAMYSHARMFCTLAHTSSIPWVQCIYTCKNVFYTHWYHFYSPGCDVFTCKDVLYTHSDSYVFYSHGCSVFIHARTFFTLTDTTSIPMGAVYLYMQERFLHSLIPLLCPWVQCIYTCKNVFYTRWYDLIQFGAPIFTMITEVWPRANCAVVTNNLLW